MGMVAPSAHHSGSTKSATKPNSVKVIQKIFRSTALKSTGARTRLELLQEPNATQPTGAARWKNTAATVIVLINSIGGNVRSIMKAEP
jgi:hypothetical protein